MIEWLKETLIGHGCLLGLWLLAAAHNIYNKISEEGSKRGRMLKKIGNISGRTFLIYMIVGSFVIPLITLIIWLFT